MRAFTKEERQVLKYYVSNIDSDVYTIFNLPEEVIAVIFAYVSRSDKSFKENLLHLVKDGIVAGQAHDVNDTHAIAQVKAAEFHKRWVVGYGHSCYDQETDVLTRQGWKRWDQVKMTDELASVHPETFEVEYQFPVHLIAEPYKGKMYKVDRNRLDMLVTPNHKVLAWPRHKIEGFETRKYQLIKAEDLHNKCYKVKLGGLRWSGDIVEDIHGFPAESMLKMIGFFIGDGYSDARMKNSIQFHLKKKRKVEYLYRLCSELGLTISANKNDKYYITGQSDSGISIGNALSDCYTISKEKQIPEELFDLDSALLQNLYDGLLNSDGSIGRTGEVYDTSSVVLVNQIQHLCVLLGWTSSITLLHPAETHTRRDGWRVFINKSLLESMVNKVQYDIFDEWVDYDGMVYCAELPKYHTLIIRRNGRIHVSGNSVAEHATAHVGVEKVSRIASAELELAHRFNSFTEYSQRYQKPQRGDFHIPAALDNYFVKEFTLYNHKLYDLYEELQHGLETHLLISGAVPKKEGETTIQHERRIEKMAFEDARSVLSLATYTNLGMTGNGRGLRDTIVELLTSSTEESNELGRRMEKELYAVMPSLLRHVKPDEAKQKALEKVDALFLSHINSSYDGTLTSDLGDVTLFPLTDDEGALTLLLHGLLINRYNLPPYVALQKVREIPYEQKQEIFEALTEDLKPYSNPVDALRQIQYRTYFCISEACWHQLLRHNRGADFIYQTPTIQNGFVIPENIKAAGLEDTFRKAMLLSEEMVLDLEFEYGKEVAQYAVTNAHKRGILMTASAWELFHLLNLRTSPEAQREIRKVFEDLYDLLAQANPTIFKYARRRLVPEEQW